jgi:hypothetical protein
MSDSGSGNGRQTVNTVLSVVGVMIPIAGLIGLNVWYLASYGQQLATLANEVQQLRTLTQGLDGSLRPEGTLSAEMKALQQTVADAARQSEGTRQQLNALIQALGRGKKPPGKPGDD